MNNYEPIIGLEIHAELSTQTKMFCDCLNDPNERHPNINICPICMGHPGTLPVINKEAIRKIVLVGLSLHGEIAEFSQFDRKQYFYPDLPKGYQISQYKHPIVQGGYLELPKQGRKISLTRVHLEEDAGRLAHGKDATLVDFNRAGVALMELVTEPDMRNAEEAKKFAETLQLLLRYTGVSHADMEKGEMRIEANVSLHKPSDPYGTKVEVKNINSFRAVEKAIHYEISRQTDLLEKGEKVIQETRGWDDVKEMTVSQRKKEEANDYRYFPEPDLPPLRFAYDFINDVLKELPELPEVKRTRFLKEFMIPEKIADVLISDRRYAAFFEQSVSELQEWGKEKGIAELDIQRGTGLLANYLTSDFLALLNKASASIEDTRVTPENFAELITLLLEKKISTPVAKIVLQCMFQTGNDPSNIVKEKNLEISQDDFEIDVLVKKIITTHAKPVEDYKKGKAEALQFLIGQVMRELRGRADPEIVKAVLLKKLQ